MQQSTTFISYSKVDGEFAMKIANDLRAAGVSIWIDQLDIPPGSRWDRSIEAAMAAAGRMIVVLSPTSTASENVQDEIGLAFDTRKHVIPVLCKPCDVPMRLRRLQYIDFTGDYDAAFKRLLAVAQLPIAAPTAGAPASMPMSAPSMPAPKPAGGMLSTRNIGIGAAAVVVLLGAAYGLKLSGMAKEFKCEDEETLMSTDEGKAQTLTIENKLANPVKLVWINQDGKTEEMASVDPNAELKQDTFAGHYWVLKDIQGQCLKIVMAPGRVRLP